MDREGRGDGHTPSDVGEGDRALPDHLPLDYCHREVLERNGEVSEARDVGRHSYHVGCGASCMAHSGGGDRDREEVDMACEGGQREALPSLSPDDVWDQVGPLLLPAFLAIPPIPVWTWTPVPPVRGIQNETCLFPLLPGQRKISYHLSSSNPSLLTSLLGFCDGSFSSFLFSFSRSLGWLSSLECFHPEPPSNKSNRLP